MNFKEEADILAQTYYHTMTVERPVEILDELGFDAFKMQEIYKDIACAISFNQGSNEDLSTTTQPIQYIATLFTRPEIKIEAGDIIKANVLGDFYQFRAGEGVIYQSHIEVPLIRKDDA